MSAPMITRGVRLLHYFGTYSARICYCQRWQKLTPTVALLNTNTEPCRLFSKRSDVNTPVTSSSTTAKPGTPSDATEDSSSSSDSSSDGESSSDSSDDEEAVGSDMSSAVDRVAKSLPGESAKTKSDLLQKLQETAALTSAQKSGQLPPDVSSMLSKMRIQSNRRSQEGMRGQPFPREQRGPPREQRGSPREQGSPRDQQGSSRDKHRKPYPEKSREQRDHWARARGPILEKVKLFGSSPLGIFPPPTPKDIAEESGPQSLFDEIEQEEKLHQMTFPPVNAFHEMISWTREGKMWTYPIDNEQGLEQEAQVGFHEHVFLEPYLEDFPKKGPVRHFMELVITGLSKNPYITVQQKQDHIEWYKNYFQDKYTLIEELTIVKKTESNL